MKPQYFDSVYYTLKQPMYSIPFTIDDLVTRSEDCRDGGVLFYLNGSGDAPIISWDKRSEDVFELIVGYSED